MICFIALIIFGILGIFSATHRKLAGEAFDCVFRKITLRKCTTGLDVKLKSTIASKFLEKNQKLGIFVFRYFEVLSWLFTFLTIGSLVWTGLSAYNYYEYGNCNGLSIEDQQGLCLFDPTKEHAQITTCSDTGVITPLSSQPNLKDVDLSLFPTYQSKEVKDQLIYVGCYACPNTKKVNQVIDEIVLKNKETIKFVFIHLPLHQDYEYINRIENCLYPENKVAYWEFHKRLMEMPLEELKIKEKVVQILDQLPEIKANKILICSETEEAQQLLGKQLNEIKKMNIEGTPTIFVNEQAFIGPKQARVYERQLSTNTDWFGMALIGLGITIALIILYFALFKREK